MTTPKRDDYSEDQIRGMEAGKGLDRICAEWLGTPTRNQRQWKYAHSGHGSEGWHNHPPEFSYSWAHAGRLLEAMPYHHEHPATCLSSPLWEGCRRDGLDDKWVMGVGNYDPQVGAPTPQLAIARAAALLWLRGVGPREVTS